MNATYSKLYNKVLNAVHPDKVAPELKEKATKLTALVNAARDKNDEGFIQRVADLIDSGEIWSWNPDSFYAKQEKSNGQSKTKGEKPAEKEPVVREDWLQAAKEQQKARGFDRSKMAAWLNLEFNLKGKAARAYLDLIFVKGEAGRKGPEGYVGAYYERLKKGPMDENEFKEWINSQSRNCKAHERHYNNLRELANEIWSKVAS